MGLGDFPEEFGSDGEVEIPFKLDYTEALGSEAEPVNGSTPCNCDPADVIVIKDKIIRAAARHRKNSSSFDDPDYQEELKQAHVAALVCSTCLDPLYITTLEIVMDIHGIPYG